MYRTLSTFGIILATTVFTACSDSVGPRANATVSIQDQCDPASFNAALGAGTCTKQGSVTFAQFNSELNSTQKVAAWQFAPSNLTIRIGQSIAATNDGGEVHTFTEVAEFGGGFIPGLNKPGETPVPECEGGFSNVAVARTRILQGSQLQVSNLAKGKHLFQCCIHPWMRMEVDVK